MTYTGNGVQQQLDDQQIDIREQNELMKKMSASALLDTDLSKMSRDYQQQQLQPQINVQNEREQMVAEHQETLLQEMKRETPTVLESFTAMFELENPISAIIANTNLPYVPDIPDYNPLELEGELEGYEQYARYFADSRNPATTAVIKGNIDRERYNRDILERTSTTLSIISGVASGFGDPITLALLLATPLTGGASGSVALGSKLSTAGKIGVGIGIGATHTAINEVLLHDIQATRTLDESGLNLVTSLIFDSVIGTIVAAKGFSLDPARNQIKKYFKDGGKPEMADPFTPSQVKSMGAAEVVPGAGAPEIESGMWFLGPVALKMAKITPIGRTMQSESGQVRQASLDLAENNYLLQGDELGPVAAETLIKTDIAKARESIIEIENLQKKAANEMGMSESQFEDAIDYALRRGDQHENPFVQEAAQRYRATLQENWDRAAEFNVDATRRTVIDEDTGQPKLDKDGAPITEAVEQTTAESYQSRVYSREAIDADPEAFRDAVRQGGRQSIIDQNAKLDSRVAEIETVEGPKIMLKQTAYDELAVSNKNITKQIRLNEKNITDTQKRIKNTDKADFEARERMRDEIDTYKSSIKTQKAEISTNKKERLTLRKDMDEYKKSINTILKQKQTIDEDSINEFAQGFYESVQDLKVGDSHWNVEGKPNVFKPRTPIKDEYLEPFLEKSWKKRLNQQVLTLAPRARLAQKFGRGEGDYNMTQTLKDIEAEYKNAIAAMKEDPNLSVKEKSKQEAKFRKDMRSELKDLETMKNRLLGKIAGADPNSTAQSLGRSLMSFNSTRMLNGMLLSSIPEVGKLMAKHGVFNTIKAIAKQARYLKLNNLPKEHAARLASATYRAQEAKTAQMTDMIDLTPSKGFEKVTSRLAHWTYKLSGQQHFDSLFRGASGSLASDGFARAIKTGDHGKLRKAGFTADQIKVAEREMAIHGEMIDGLWEPKVDQWDLTSVDNKSGYRPQDLMDTYEAAIIKESDMLIVQPGVGDRPVFMDNMTMRMMFQFKTFILGATNRTLVPMAQGSLKDAATLIGFQSGLGLLGYAAYMAGSGRYDEIDWDDTANLTKQALERGGYAGYAMEMLNMAEKTAGVSLFGDESSRYRSRDTVGALLGPSFGTASDITKAFNLGTDEYGDANVDVDSRVHAMRKLLPFQNHFLMRSWIDEREADIAKSMGGSGRFGAEDRGAAL